MSPGAARHAALPETRHFTLLRLVRKLTHRDWVLLYDSLAVEMALVATRLGDWLLTHAARCGGGDVALLEGLAAAWRCFSNWWLAVEQFTDELDSRIEWEREHVGGGGGGGGSGGGGSGDGDDHCSGNGTGSSHGSGSGGDSSSRHSWCENDCDDEVNCGENEEAGDGHKRGRGAAAAAAAAAGRQRAQAYLRAIDRDSGRDRDVAPHTPFLGDKACLAFRLHLLLRLEIWRPLRAATHALAGDNGGVLTLALAQQLLALLEAVDRADDHKAEAPLSQGAFRATLLQPAAQLVLTLS